MKIMAIDYGDARTGVAVSDLTGSITGSTTVIRSYNQEKTLQALQEFVESHGAEELVVGLPRNMDGSEGERAALCREFAARLEARTGRTVVLWDERNTTVDAHRILTENHRFGKKRKNTVDAVAASLILESYLGFKNKRS